MFNPYQPCLTTIKDVKLQIPGVKLFTLQSKNEFDFSPGQFVEIGLVGFGEAPFALCSSNKEKKYFQVCIRKIGKLTSALHRLKKDDRVFLRGPYGKGFPEIKEKNLLLIAGGLGIIPLRSVIQTRIWNLKKSEIPKTIVLYGAKKSKELLFKNEYKTWQKAKINLYLTLDKPEAKWKGHSGLITNLFDEPSIRKELLISDSPFLAFLCGPPIMYRFVLKKLKELEIPEKNIYFSLERRIDCGIGVCQHCAIGTKYVCKDGPVFSWQEIKEIPEVV